MTDDAEAPDRWVRFWRSSVAAFERDPIVRVDPPDAPDGPPVDVDCAARWHLCRAACCRFAVPLSRAEVDAGGLTWDRARPYVLDRSATGRCCHQDAGGQRCTVYEVRPTPCRVYSCHDDIRIWLDFDRMIPNRVLLEALEQQRDALAITSEAHPSDWSE